MARLFLLSPTVVFKARVNQAIWLYPITEVSFDGVTAGSYEDIRPGMTVVFGTADGLSDHGRQRVRNTTADTLYIGRSSIGIRDGEAYPHDNDYITVWDDYRVWSKIPLIEPDGTIYKDSDIEFTGQTDEIPPKANIYPPAAAGDIDDDDDVLTVSFSGTGSYALSGTIAEYSWDVIDGTITVGTATDDEITATFPAGFRWVSLLVTDSNGNTHMMRTPVYARNPASDTTIKAWQIERHTIGVQGQEISLKILESIPEGTYPDGTLVMIWENDTTVITAANVGFVGWHHTDPAQIDAERTAVLSEVTLDCLDMAGKLKTLPGFPLSVEGIDPPTSWLEMSAPNMDKYIDYLLRWHSTALELVYVTLSGTGSNYPFVILGSDASSLWEQAARRAQSLVPDYVLTCDSLGRIAMKVDPIIQAVADRTATAQAALTEDDWSGISYTRQRAPRVHWLRSEAVLASADTVGALFCVAPDDTPGQGVSSRTQGEQLARGQTDLNAAEGNRYARLNAFESHFRIDLAGNTRLGIEPAAMTWVSLTVNAAYAAQRGLTFTAARGIVHEITVSYRYGRTGLSKSISLTWEKETDGPAAKGYIPPSIEPEIPYEPPPDPGFDPDPIPTAGTGFGTVYAVSISALGRTRDFSAASPAWVDIKPGGSPGALWDFILDPWSPATTGYLTADAGIYRSTDLDEASPSWTLIVSAGDIETAASLSDFGSPAKIVGSINLEGYFALFHTMANAYTVYVTYTTDAFATWDTVQVCAPSADNDFLGGADIVPHLVSGNIVLYVPYKSGTVVYLAKSTNGGASWSSLTGVDVGGGNRALGALSTHCPYEGNEAGNICYFTMMDLDGSSWYYYAGKTSNGSDVETVVPLTGLTFGSSKLAKRTGLESYTQDRLRMYRWVNNLLYTSLDGFSTETAVTTSGISGNVLASGGFPYNAAQFYALSSLGIFVSTDGGSTWVEKTGDWSFGLTTTGNGTGVIVPLWTE